MAKLIIKRASGEVSEHEITPIIEYAFEQHFKNGFHKYFREDEQQTAVYWLAWECIRRSGETVKPFGEQFIETLSAVEVAESAPN